MQPGASNLGFPPSFVQTGGSIKRGRVEMYYHYLLHGGGGATDTRFPTPEKKEKKTKMLHAILGFSLSDGAGTNNLQHDLGPKEGGGRKILCVLTL